MPRFAIEWPKTSHSILRCWSPNFHVPYEAPDFSTDGLRATPLAKFESGRRDLKLRELLEWRLARLAGTKEPDPRSAAGIESDALSDIDTALDGASPYIHGTNEFPESLVLSCYSSDCALFEVEASDWLTCRNRADALSLALELLGGVPASFPCYWGREHEQREPRRLTWSLPVCDGDAVIDQHVFGRLADVTRSIEGVIGRAGFGAQQGMIVVAEGLRDPLLLRILESQGLVRAYQGSEVGLATVLRSLESGTPDPSWGLP